MAKVTSKLQVTIPRRIADEYCIAPGDDIEFVPSGASIRIAKSTALPAALTPAERLQLFDQATTRQRARKKRQPHSGGSDKRGWEPRGWVAQALMLS